MDQQEPPSGPNNLVAGTANWGETPPAPLNLRPHRDFSTLEGIAELPYRGPRFETDQPESFREWHRNERRELRAQGMDLLRGEPVNGRELLGNILTNLLGNAMRSADDSRATPYDHMRERTDGIDRDRDGYRR